MTLPAVVGKWQKTVHINQMKHTYSVIANAFQMSMQDNGNPKEWYWGTDGSKENLTRVVETYLIPYLNLDTKNTEQSDQWNQFYIARLKNGTTLGFVLDGCTDPKTCNPILIDTLYIVVSTKGKVSGMFAEDRDYSREDFILDLIGPTKHCIFSFGVTNPLDKVLKTMQNTVAIKIFLKIIDTIVVL